MAERREIPQLAAELFEMSKEYLRQETIKPARRLGRNAGLGLGGAALLALASIFFTLGLFALLRVVLPDSPWYSVLARLLTAVGAGATGGAVVWRMTR